MRDPLLERIVELEKRIAKLERWRDEMVLLYGDPEAKRPEGVIVVSEKGKTK